MKFLLRLSPVLLAVALLGTTQLSCSVNDYCLNCDNGDGGGSGSGSDAGTDGNRMDAAIDAGCIPTGGPEECNGKDDDCNGTVDDNPEHVGEPCDNLNGACAGGTKVCTNGDLKCNKLPKPEICNGIDDNCSGPIGTSNGIDEGDPGPAPQEGLMPELGAQCANGLDDDGDQVVDDGCPGTGGKCGTDQGECQAGQYKCDATGVVRCEGFIDHTSFPELCNGKDDDCDGSIDDNVPSGGNCGPATNTGSCEFGTLNCVGGQEVCQNAVFPAFETCNNADDDCNGQTDEIFNKDTDIKNCGDCNVVCMARPNANTTCKPLGSPLKGTCGYDCKPGYKDLNGMAVDGCEFGPCFPTGTEECDGEDNDCDGLTDAQDPDLVVPNLCLHGGECGGSYASPTGPNPLGPAPAAVCEATGWQCHYPGITQGAYPDEPNAGVVSTETRCDGKDNNCDGNIDEFQLNLHATCHEDREDPATQCNDMIDNDGDGVVNDGCPAFMGAGEALTACNDVVDDDLDGRYNDGCPAVAQRGICQATGTFECDTVYDITGPAYCKITTNGQPSASERCDDKDNDCDGNTDEGAATGVILDQEWIALGNGHQMMRYEASRPDALLTDQGSKTNLVCSKPGVLPWTNVKYQDAVSACAAVGATLCSESTWHHACSVVPMPTYPFVNANVGNATGVFIEAEDYSAIASAGAPEIACNDALDNDNDGRVNDGCPVVGTVADTICSDAVDDGDADDIIVNDGCPAVGPQAWVPDYTKTVGNGTAPNNVSKFSGISSMEAVANIGGTIAVGSIATQSPRLDYTVNFPATSATYHIWVKVFANNTADDLLYISVDGGAPVVSVTAAAPASCAATSTCPVGSTCIDTNGTGGVDTCTPVWQWVNTTWNLPSGNHTINVYMGDDGVKIDRLFIVNGATNANTAETSLTSAGNKWAYATATNPNLYNPNTCNGHDYRQISITSASRTSGGVATITTSGAHPFIVGDLVQILGTSSLTYEGVYTVLSVTATTFTYQQNTTNTTGATGGTATEAKDPLLGTGTLSQAMASNCYAAVGTGIFDMSGNAREWTLAHSTGENPIRGGASNGTADGISCALNFTLADDTFFFPNIGFRCCK